MWTLAAAAANKQTFTIEPSPMNYHRICETVNKNSFHDRVHLMNIAATNTPQVFHLNVPKGNKGGTFVTEANPDDIVSAEESKPESGGRDDTDSRKNMIIKGFPIDSLKLPTNLPVVMKVDVEGHELQALLGALFFIQEANIVYAAMELRPRNLRKHKIAWTKVFNILSSKGLVPFRADPAMETELNPNNLHEWVHLKHPQILYFDVIWRKKD